jgi:hypothetical protein
MNGTRCRVRWGWNVSSLERVFLPVRRRAANQGASMPGTRALRFREIDADGRIATYRLRHGPGRRRPESSELTAFCGI